MYFAPERTITDVVTDFLSSTHSLEEIAAYRLPDEIQERAHYLLQQNRDGSLSTQEQLELEEFRQIDHLLIMVKAKAQLKLKQMA
jgi:hypothetical protein